MDAHFVRVVDRGAIEPVAWADGCLAWPLVDGPSLSVKSEWLRGGGHEVTHRHDRSRQFFFVLTGTATVVVEGQVHRLNAHQGLEVPPGDSHVVSAYEDQPVDLLVISAPSTAGDRRVDDRCVSD